MEKLFYTAQDISEMLGYSKDKAYRIIKELNIKLKEKAKEENKEVLIFNGRINKDYFDKRIKLEV